MHHSPHFKHEMEDVECKFCTEYNKKQGGCTRRSCPWQTERIQTSTAGRTALRLLQGTPWLDAGHQQRMEQRKAGGRRSKPHLAAMYLLTADREIASRTADCFRRDGIAFQNAVKKGIPLRDYALLSAARDICADGGGITLSDLVNKEVIDAAAFCLIVNALLIARYGITAPVLRGDAAEMKDTT